MTLRRLLTALIAAALVGVTQVRADVLVFKNKDRLAGTLISQEGGKIRFNSNSLGEIVVDASVARVELTDAPAPPPPPFPVVEEFRTIDVRSVATSPSRVLAASPTKWKRRVEFGLTGQAGRTDKSDLSFRFEADRRARASETRFLARYFYGEADDVRTADSADANLRLRRNLSPVLFAQSASVYNRDLIKRIQNDVEQSFGLGRNLIDRNNLILALGGGAAARYRDQLGSDAAIDYLLNAFQDLRIAVNQRFSLAQDFSFVIPPANADDYSLKLATALVGRITETLNLSVRYELEYDRSLARDTRSSQRLVTALGYTF